MYEMDVVERYREAQEYLDGGAPLGALQVLSPVHDEIAEQACGQLLLGRAYYHSAQLNRAREAFERVLELDPVDSYAQFALGRVLERQNKLAEAQAHYRLAVAMQPNPEYRARLDAVSDRLAAAA